MGTSSHSDAPAASSDQLSREVTVISTFPLSAWETGQSPLACSAAFPNSASSIPGTSPVTSSADLVIPVPGTKLTAAKMRSRSAV